MNIHSAIILAEELHRTPHWKVLKRKILELGVMISYFSGEHEDIAEKLLKKAERVARYKKIFKFL